MPFAFRDLHHPNNAVLPVIHSNTVSFLIFVDMLEVCLFDAIPNDQRTLAVQLAITNLPPSQCLGAYKIRSTWAVCFKCTEVIFDL